MVERRGVGAMGCLVYIVMIGFTAYIAWPIGAAYLDFYRFRDAMKQEARFAAQRTDQQIQLRLRSFADSLEMPERARFVRVQRRQRIINISASYGQEITVPLLGPRDMDFNPLVEARF